MNALISLVYNSHMCEKMKPVKMQLRHGKFLKSIMLGLSSALFVACTGSAGEGSTQQSVKVKSSQITESMAEFAGLVGEINVIVGHREQSPDAAAETITRLKRLEEISENLGAGKRISNHIQLEENIHQLRSDIRTARSALEFNPPNFYWAEKVSSYCEGCHAFPR